jgi:hypothetical protein
MCGNAEAEVSIPLSKNYWLCQCCTAYMMDLTLLYLPPIAEKIDIMVMWPNGMINIGTRFGI